jgi:hypothetical protein
MTGIELQLRPFLTFALDGSECLFHASTALSSRLNPESPSRHSEKEKTIFPPSGIPGSPSPQGSFYIVYATYTKIDPFTAQIKKIWQIFSVRISFVPNINP